MVNWSVTQKRLGCYFQGQDSSGGSQNQNMTVSIITDIFGTGDPFATKFSLIVKYKLEYLVKRLDCFVTVTVTAKVQSFVKHWIAMVKVTVIVQNFIGVSKSCIFCTTDIFATKLDVLLLITRPKVGTCVLDTEQQ